MPGARKKRLEEDHPFQRARRQHKLSCSTSASHSFSEERDYIVVLFQGTADPVIDKEIAVIKESRSDGHAGEEETSMMFYIRPDLVDRQAIGSESGANQARLGQMKNGYTGIWWYARYPNHYAGDLAQPDRRTGRASRVKRC